MTMKPTFMLLAVLLLARLAAAAAAELPFPAGIQHARVERSDSDKYQFLHDPAVQLLSHGGVLHAFVGTMQGGHDLIKSCAVYVLDEATSCWQPRGEIADLILPNCQPIKMADGNWIMAGRSASRFGVKPFIPAVAISQEDDLTGRWNVVPLQGEMTPAHCPETTVWVEGS
jgi:hypothetical protein